MAKANVAYFAFNRGLVSKYGLARSDVKRLTISAQRMNNWMPKVLGSMALRVGWKYLGSVFNDSATRLIAFLFSTTDQAIIETTDSMLRVWVDDAVVTRPHVSTAITNGTFAGNLNGWTDSDQGGCTSQWVAAPIGEAVGNYMQLVGTGLAYAIRDQDVPVTGADQGVEHALRIVVARGPVILRVGSSQNDDDYIKEASLETGIHSLTFTPTTQFWVQFKSLLTRITLVQSCTVEAAGEMEIPTSWDADDLQNIRSDQSADVVFVACKGQQQRRIVRRTNQRSWGVELYLPPDGPFLIENVSITTLTPSDITGNITIAASDRVFKAGHVGALFKMVSTGQNLRLAATGDNEFTNAIRITGVGATRAFSISVAGTFSATATLQQSLTSATGPWTDVTATGPWTVPVATVYNDALDNVVAYYRLGVKTGDFASGEADLGLFISSGTITGVVRITAFTDEMNVNAEVVKDLGTVDATDVWSEGAWSDVQGWPTCVGFHEGRLWWAGKNGIWGSISDAFDSFDEDVTGDSGTIFRSFGSGMVDTINWIVSLARMILGAQGAEFVARSSSLDEPLTPTNFNLKAPSTQGSGTVQAIKIDNRGILIQRGGTRVYEVLFDVQSYDFQTSHLTKLVPEVGRPSVVRLSAQRQPDTRIHAIRSDGVAAIMVYDKVEDVNCWLTASTDGIIEDVAVLSAEDETADDRVYYVVKRTINGVTKRYMEKWAQEDDCVGATANQQADAFISYSGAPTSTITGLDHLEAKTVIVWGDGVYQGTAVVAGGQITTPGGTLLSDAIVGLAYTGQWQSGKLLQLQTQTSNGVNMKKTIQGLGLVLDTYHPSALTFGPDFDHMDNMPLMGGDGALIDPDTIQSEFDEQMIVFSSNWDTDARLCLQATAPLPVTVLSAICDVDMP